MLAIPDVSPKPRAVFTPRWYQAEATQRAVEFLRTSKGQNGVLVLPTGAGKSIVIANIVRELQAPTLIFQPNKEILEQNVDKYRAYGYGCGIYSASAGTKNLRDVTFATVGSVVKKKHLLERFKYVLVDECFPAGTLIDGRPIESIHEGDMVASYNHHQERVEMRRVVRLFRHQRKNRLVRVTLTNGASFVCTYNHPVHTVENGYVPAGFLTTETVLFKHGHENASSAMPSVSERGANGRVPAVQLQQDGQGILLKGMREQDEVRCASEQRGEGAGNAGMAPTGIRSNEDAQPNVDARRQGENDGQFKGQNIPGARGQRGSHEAPDDVALGHGITNGACDRYGGRKGHSTIIAPSLQGGPCRTGSETCDRGGWEDAQAEEMALPGPQEDYSVERIGVASVEIYQRAGGDGNQEVREDDIVYNFEVEGNHNYFANGVLVHNCHLVNSNGGMYEEVLDHMGVPTIGLTATPYRLGKHTDPNTWLVYSMLKFITRTNPRIFGKVVYHVQNRTLFDEGYLAKLEYYEVNAINRAALQRNSTGADYTDESVRQQYAMAGFQGKLVKVVNRLLAIGRKNVLVFTRFVDEARWLTQQLHPMAAIVTAETPKKERERVINGFKAGRIKVVCNVGILTTGFDYPELEAVVIARPTMSLALWYQMVGRGIRPHPDKTHTMIVDMGGNLAQFGKVEDLELSEEGGWHVRSHGRQLTNVPFGKPYKAQR